MADSAQESVGRVGDYAFVARLRGSNNAKLETTYCIAGGNRYSCGQFRVSRKPS